MSAAFTVDINPKILSWARTDSGVEIREIAEHLKVDPETIEDWEKVGKDIKYSDLKKIASYYKRQVPVFFLAELPAKTKKPRDFRNLNLKDKNLHRDTLLAIRRTSRYLEIYRTANDDENIEKSYHWLSSIKSHDSTTIPELRAVLDVTLMQQRENKTNAFTFWRDRFENNLNIFVFQFAIGNDEFDGYSFVEDGKPYGITINSHISEFRKVFTLFHELGHIIEGESGLCFTVNDKTTFNSVETRCNRFAAEFLMPETEIIPPDTYDELKRNANGLGVSTEAYLIRCKELELIKIEKYRELMRIIIKINKDFKKKKLTGGPSPLQVSKSQRGNKFFDFVLRAYDSKRLSPTLVRDVLGLKVASLGKQDN